MESIRDSIKRTIAKESARTVDSKCVIHKINKILVAGTPVVYCPECVVEEQSYSYEERKQKTRQEFINKRLHNSMMSPRFITKRLDNYKADNDGQKKALEMSRWFIDNLKESPGMIFIGCPGTGKNHLACGIIHEIIERGNTALITTAMKIIRSIKDSWVDRTVKEGDILKLYIKPDLLVIDEVGVQFGSDTEKLYISEIINDRYEAVKPTILMGNISIKELIDELGDRPIDRFREGGKIVKFDWDSFRKGN